MSENSIENPKSFIESNKDIDFNQVLKFFIRNKFFISKVVIVFFLGSLIVASIKEKIWQGKFDIVLDTEKNSLSEKLSLLSPGISELAGASKQNSLNTQVGILESTSVLMPIFEFVRNEKTLKNSKFDYNFQDWKKDFLKINLKEKTSILNISYKDSDRELILPVLNKITKAYQKYSGKAKKRNTQLAKKYLSNQINIYKDKSFQSLKKVQEYSIDQDLQILDLGINLPRLSGNSSNFFSRGDSQDNNKGNENIENTLITNASIETVRVNAANRIRKINIMLDKINNYKSDQLSLEYLITSIPSISDSELINKLNIVDNVIIELNSKYTNQDPTLKRYLNKKESLIKLIKNKAVGYLIADRLNQESIMEASIRPKGVLLKYKELMRLALRDETTLVNLENQLRVISLEEARLEDPWELISKPTLKEKSVSPRKSIYAFFGSLIGLSLGSLGLFLKERYLGLVFNKDYIEEILGTKIVEEIDLFKKDFKFYTKDIFVNEILRVSKSVKFNFLILGKVSDQEYEEFINLISGEKKINCVLEKNLSGSSDFKEYILLAKIGTFNFTELDSLKNRLNISNKKVSGIVLFGD